MAEVSSQATIMFDVEGLAGTPSGSGQANDDLTRAIKQQNILTERANRLAEAQRTGSYTNPTTGATTGNKRVIDFLNDLERKASAPTPGFGGREWMASKQATMPDWATNFNQEVKKTGEGIGKMGGILAAAGVAITSATFDIMKSTIGSNSYDYANKLAEGQSSAMTSGGMGIGGMIGGMLGMGFGPGGAAAGAYFGGQLGSEIGSYFGKQTTTSAYANTQLRALSGLTGGQFGDYSNLKANLGGEQPAQDFMGVAKNVMAGTSGMSGLTGNAGVEFSKTFTSEFKNTLTGQEQGATANTLAALVSHSGLGRDSATTAKAVSQLADMAKASGVMPSVLANSALNYQSVTGSRDYNEALKYAQLSTSAGSSIAGMSQSAALSDATSTIQSEALLNTLGLSLDDIKSGNYGKIASKIGKPTTGKTNAKGEMDINPNQILFEAAGYPYKPFYNAAKTGTSITGETTKAGADYADNTKDMTITAGTIYLSGNIVTSSNSATEGATATTPRQTKQPIAKFDDNTMIPPIVPAIQKSKVTH